VVILPRFEPQSFLGALQDHKVTIAHLVPPIILLLAKHPLVDKFNLSSLKVINSGAAPLGQDLQVACSERLKSVIVKQGYGMTELSPVSHVTPPGGKEKVIAGSVGLLLPNMEAKIVSVETGEALPTGPQHTGEMWLRGPNVMRGYMGLEKETADTLDSDQFLSHW